MKEILGKIGNDPNGESWGGGYALDQSEVCNVEKALGAIIKEDARFTCYRWVHFLGYDLITVSHELFDSHSGRVKWGNLPTFFIFGVWGSSRGSKSPAIYWKGNQPDGSWAPLEVTNNLKCIIHDFVVLSEISFPPRSPSITTTFP